MRSGLDLPDVSRETLERLKHYEQMVFEWTPKINLVSKATLKEFSSRHIADSAQVFEHLKLHRGNCLDLGSGGGLPGIVIAILAKSATQDLNVEMIESDRRKAVFLRSVCRELDLPATITCDRIEEVEPRHVPFITSRALAPLDILLSYIERHMMSDGIAILHKGRNWKNEIQTAEQQWHFDYEPHKSKVNSDSVILKVRNVRHA